MLYLLFVKKILGEFLSQWITLKWTKRFEMVWWRREKAAVICNQDSFMFNQKPKKCCTLWLIMFLLTIQKITHTSIDSVLCFFCIAHVLTSYEKQWKRRLSFVFYCQFFNVSLPLIGQNNVLVLKEHPYFKFEQIVIFKWSKEKGTVVSY